MADELDLDNLDNEIEKDNRVEKRIKDLSEKVRLTSEERDEQKKLLQDKISENDNLKKEHEFLNSFGMQVGKYPEAANLKDKIKERVLKGYSVEDATAAVLVAEGKYSPPKIEQPIGNFAGGSATTQHPTGDKSFSQMTSAEKRAELVKAESRGDISMT